MTRVHLYHDPNTSESSGEWDTVRDALIGAHGQTRASRLVSNGETIAKPANGNWTLTTIGFDRLAKEQTK